MTTGLMQQTAALAEELDVRLHTHLAENVEDDDFSMATYGMRCVEHFEHCGWLSDRSWVAHCVRPNPNEVVKLGTAGVGIAHCPSSNLILSSGIAPVAEFRAAGSPVGLGCDGSSSADCASLWQEARQAMLLGKLRNGADSMPARSVLDIATRGGAACLGRSGEIGELSLGAVADIAVWKLDGPAFAGVLDDLIEGWLRCGPVGAHHTIVNGESVVNNGELTSPRLEEMLTTHRTVARRFQPEL